MGKFPIKSYKSPNGAIGYQEPHKRHHFMVLSALKNRIDQNGFACQPAAILNKWHLLNNFLNNILDQFNMSTKIFSAWEINNIL